MSELPTYVLERTFDAPCEMVWRTWTDPELLQRWYGPGVETVIHKLDVTPGGLWLNEMKWGENSHYQRVEYTEVSKPGRLVWLHSNCDADWNVLTHTWHISVEHAMLQAESEYGGVSDTWQVVA